MHRKTEPSPLAARKGALVNRSKIWPWVALLCLITHSVQAQPAAAPVGNPFDDEQRAFAREVIARGTSARAQLPLIELWRNWGRATPAVTRAELERVIASRAISEPTRAYARALLARVRSREGALDVTRTIIRELGYVTDFNVVGPFDNEGKAGFDNVFGPEEARMAPFDPDAVFPGKEREVAWRRYPSDTSLFGYIDFDATMRPYENVCAYAQTTITSERAQPLALFTGAGGAIRVWWNGEPVFSDTVYREPDGDRSAIVVGAHRGPNRVLVKVCQTDATWGFFLRVADQRGAAARGVTISSTETGVPQAGHGVTRLPTLRLALAELEAAVVPADAAPLALEELARFLVYTGADDPAEHRARQIINRAVDAQATVERLRLAASLAENRADVMRLFARAKALAPNDPEVALFEAGLRHSSLHPSDALGVLDRFTGTGTFALRALDLRAAVYATLEMPESAYATMQTLVARAPDAYVYTNALARNALALGRADEAMALRHRTIAIKWDDVDARRSILADALRRRDNATVTTQLDAIVAVSRSNGATMRYAASVYEALHRVDDALAALAVAKALTPHDPIPLVTEGRLLLRLGRTEEASTSLRAALELRPQDAETRELLEQLSPETRADEAYAVDQTTLLGRRAESAGYPYSTLQSLTVNTVYTNGLGSSFHQVGVQIHDEEGARRFRTYAIQYTPGSQRVEVRLARIYRANGEVLEGLETYERPLGEPWYRIYYDTRALIVVFPDLEPGDVIELRYRTDDVSHRNLFADYYGDIHYLQADNPIRHHEYVLRTPAARNFYFNEPTLTGLTHERTEAAGIRTDRFVAENVPALTTEAQMPGLTDISPYLHVSTYRTWEDVGRWYWGLVQDQLNPDESLRRTVRELVADAPDVETKVRRIHDWVVDHTRYVGLEFGIHGFKPYRVSQIVARGFGDCKDKASLLFSMFREAGVEAEIVLLRTRRNGGINDLPASLAVFDHAIAYVPALDLYIDGTAEHSGMRELPGMDQGVTVLHVSAAGARLRRTPVHPATANTRERTMTITLAADGSGTLAVRERITGVEAAGYRSSYQSEGTRAERFERSLQGMFPGLHLVSQTFGDLEDLERPIEVSYEASVPQIAQRDGGALRVGTTVLGELSRMLAPGPTRRFPLELGTTVRYVEERLVRLPAGMTLRQAPENANVTSRFGSFTTEVESRSGEVRIRTVLELTVDRVAPAEYAEFRTFLESIDRVLRQRLTVGGAQ